MSLINVKNHYPHYLKNKGILYLGCGGNPDLSAIMSCEPKHVLMVEALYHLSEDARKKAARYPNVRTINTIISNRNTLTSYFNLCSPPEHSSLLTPYPNCLGNVRVTGGMYLKTICLDTLLIEYNVCRNDCNAMFLSLNGAELLALEGASELLSSGNPDLIGLELWDVSPYKGGPNIDDMEDFLRDFNYYLIEIWDGYGVFLKDRKENQIFTRAAEKVEQPEETFVLEELIQV